MSYDNLANEYLRLAKEDKREEINQQFGIYTPTELLKYILTIIPTPLITLDDLKFFEDRGVSFDNFYALLNHLTSLDDKGAVIYLLDNYTFDEEDMVNSIKNAMSHFLLTNCSHSNHKLCPDYSPEMCEIYLDREIMSFHQFFHWLSYTKYPDELIERIMNFAVQKKYVTNDNMAMIICGMDFIVMDSDYHRLARLKEYMPEVEHLIKWLNLIMQDHGVEVTMETIEILHNVFDLSDKDLHDLVKQVLLKDYCINLFMEFLKKYNISIN